MLALPSMACMVACKLIWHEIKPHILCVVSVVLLHRPLRPRWPSIVLALGGIISLCETPECLRGLENITGANNGIAVSRKMGGI